MDPGQQSQTSASSLLQPLTLTGGLVLGWIFFGGTPENEHTHMESMEGEKEWTCSMHPQIRTNEPGDCPICGMDLIPVEDESEGSPRT